MTYYNYPLNLRFKLIALAPRIIVTDSTGMQVAFVHQNAWKMKEDIRIFTNEDKQQEIFRINADRVLDIRAKYYFTESASGKALGYVQPRALRSIWRATYQIFAADGTITHHIREDNPWVKIADVLFGEIPILGIFSGYVFHPSYTAYRSHDTADLNNPVLQLHKQAGFFEGLFTIDDVGGVSQEEEMRLLLAMMLMIQFMRRRG
jgi:hypothetical protein